MGFSRGLAFIPTLVELNQCSLSRNGRHSYRKVLLDGENELTVDDEFYSAAKIGLIVGEIISNKRPCVPFTII